MDAGSILKWGLLAVAAIFALRFVSGLFAEAMDTNVGVVNAPNPNGVVYLYPEMVYPVRGRVRGGHGRAWKRGN